MAKNRSEPEKSVEEEEEEKEDSSTDNEGSESESESESEQPQTQKHIAKKPSAATTTTKVTEPSSSQAKIQPASSSSYETDSESDSDSESQKPAPIVHPRESAQTKSSTSPRKSGAEAKRPAPAADIEVTESKRQKRNSELVVESSEIKPSADDSKKQLFQRLWSEDDEIALLQGMIEYTEKENADPLTDLDAFHDYIRKSLHFIVSRNQLQNKIKRMKKKYQNNAGKGKKGKEKSFSKPHEQKSYELSKKIWGSVEKFEDNSEPKVVHALMACNGSAKEGKSKQNSTKKAPIIQDAIETPDANAVPNGAKKMEAEGSRRFNSSSRFMEKNKGIVISEGKRKEIEKKRKAVVVAEIDLFLKELELIQEQVKATLDAMK